MDHPWEAIVAEEDVILNILQFLLNRSGCPLEVDGVVRLLIHIAKSFYKAGLFAARLTQQDDAKGRLLLSFQCRGT